MINRMKMWLKQLLPVIYNVMQDVNRYCCRSFPMHGHFSEVVSHLPTNFWMTHEWVSILNLYYLRMAIKSIKSSVIWLLISSSLCYLESIIYYNNSLYILSHYLVSFIILPLFDENCFKDQDRRSAAWLISCRTAEEVKMTLLHYNSCSESSCIS